MACGFQIGEGSGGAAASRWTAPNSPRSASSNLRRWVTAAGAVLVPLALTLMVGVTTYELGRSSYFAWGFLQAVRGVYPDQGEVSPAPSPSIGPLAVIGPDGALGTLDLSSANGLVLLFDANCQVCGRTVPRWLDLMTDLPSTVPVYAIAPGRAETQRGYWRGLESRVQSWILATDSAIVRFGVSSTPSTIVLRNGHPTLTFQGPLDRSRRALILASLRRAQ
jgi:hypothetical protein